MHAIDTSAHGPRYPGAERFASTFGYRDYLHAVAGLRTRGSNKVLALYLHIPFRDKIPVYLSYLKREIEMQGRLFAGMNQVEQLHVGGGSAACLSDNQMADLMLHLRRWFQFAPDGEGEYAIAVDPRTVPCERVQSLRRTIIQMLMCQFELSIPAIELAYPIAFTEYFAAELAQLALLEADDLVTIEDEWITVTPKGRMMIRDVCMVFDRSRDASTN